MFNAIVNLQKNVFIILFVLIQLSFGEVNQIEKGSRSENNSLNNFSNRITILVINRKVRKLQSEGYVHRITSTLISVLLFY